MNCLDLESAVLNESSTEEIDDSCKYFCFHVQAVCKKVLQIIYFFNFLPSTENSHQMLKMLRSKVNPVIMHCILNSLLVFFYLDPMTCTDIGYKDFLFLLLLHSFIHDVATF